MGSLGPSQHSEAVAALEFLSVKENVDSIQIDVTKGAFDDAAAKHVSDKYRRLNVLVTKRCIIGQNSSMQEIYRKILVVNCVGVSSTTEAFLPFSANRRHHAWFPCLQAPGKSSMQLTRRPHISRATTNL
ncbi:hypothetical protein MMC11_004094 [Xylographa trunciseda]|nr:hypothetical protein [Xylographa trunciseda]